MAACQVCSSPVRESVERAVLAGHTLKRVGDRYGFTWQAVRRHREKHMNVEDTVAVTSYSPVIDRMEALAHRVEAALGTVTVDRTPSAFAALSKELRGCLELIARLRRELDDAPRVNVLVLPEWQKVRATMLEALLPYPEARAAVAQRLMLLEGADGRSA